MAHGDDLLPRVDVYGLSDRIRQELTRLVADAVRDAFARWGTTPQLPTGALIALAAPICTEADGFDQFWQVRIKRGQSSHKVRV
jgi:hypothetical protein